MAPGLRRTSHFLAADRIKILYAAKEACRFMAKPTDLAWER